MIGVPCRLASIALRTSERAPSQPTMKSAWICEVVSAVEVADGRNDAVVVFAEILERGAVQELKPVDGGGVREQHGLHVDLVDAVRRLGGRPIGVRAAVAV